jgi:hypothetical protein
VFGGGVKLLDILHFLALGLLDGGFPLLSGLDVDHVVLIGFGGFSCFAAEHEVIEIGFDEM